MSEELNVCKRNGSLESISFDKITKRLIALQNNIPIIKGVNIHLVVQETISKIYDTIPTTHIDELSADICVSKSTVNYAYMELGSRIVISNNHKNTKVNFIEKFTSLTSHCNIDKKLLEITKKYKKEINETLDYTKDYNFDFFSFKTLEKSYLLKINGVVVERIQDLLMRVALGIHYDDIDRVLETYTMMSDKYFIHATPTLFHAGMTEPQLLSCFLGGIHDSVDGIYKGLNNCAQISKWAGGIGMNIHNIRAKGSKINSTNGKANGIVPMLKLFNDSARFINQSGKRLGSFAIYVEPWHLEIESFIELRKNHGEENMRTRDLFLGLWIPDLFMKHIQEDKDWYLFCPNDVPDLMDCYGEEFKHKYMKYVEEGKYKKVMKARNLWFQILGSQIETGLPYLLYKDSANSKSNQKNLGTIRGSNLCTEIIEYHNEDEYACCNLGSVALPKFVKYDTTNKAFFDFTTLGHVVRILTFNLNKVIDVNKYPIPESEKSNKLHRPIGIGVQGLADVYAMFDYPFDSKEAANLNRHIFETIYYSACEESCNISIQREEIVQEYKKLIKLLDVNDRSSAYIKQLEKNKREIESKEKIIFEEYARNSHYGSYSSFIGSPMSKGKFQFDLWNHSVNDDRHDWSALRIKVNKHGIRNSLLLAPMPTASTSQILGNNECIEPFTSNIYVRNTLAGNFVVVNKHLVKKLTSLNLWSTEMKNKIIANDGSIQNIVDIPSELKGIYKTVWEISQKVLIDQAADRGVFVCQSQSLNLFIKQPSIKQLTQMHFHSWKRGLKTGIYYLRTQTETKTQQFTIEPCEMCSA